MATGQLAKSLETIVNNAAKQVGTYELGINKVLWGSGNTQPTVTVGYSNGQLQYTSSISQQPTAPSSGNILDTGIINALNALIQVDLCNVISYLANSTGLTTIPRPQGPWTPQQIALYELQDECQLVIECIDQFTANPTTLARTYLNQTSNTTSGPSQPPAGSITQTQAVAQSAAPGSVNQNTIAYAQSSGTAGSTDIQGSEVTAFNLFSLMQDIAAIYSYTGDQDSFYNMQNRNLLSPIPGIGSCLNIIDNFLGITSQYSSYQDILGKYPSNNPTQNISYLETQLTTLRTTCVTVKNLNFNSVLINNISNVINNTANYLSSDIRSQIQQLNKYLDVAQIIPTLKQIDNSVESVILIGKQIQSILKSGQALVNITVLLLKPQQIVYRFLTALPAPLQFLTAGVMNILAQLTQSCQNEIDGLTTLLTAINALLSLVVTFIRYILTCLNEIETRLQKVLTDLEGCDAVKNSAVVAQMNQTMADLQNLQVQLGSYITNYDLQTSPTSTTYQGYTINVIAEEVSTAIPTPRRRGVALNQYGAVVVQSPLTFATDTSVIIGEVEQMLQSMNLVTPTTQLFSTDTQAVINTSLSFLNSSAPSQIDLSLPTGSIDLPNNLNTNSGLGLNAFVNNLKGGQALRTRTRAALANATQALQAQLTGEAQSAQQTLSGSGIATTAYINM